MAKSVLGEIVVNDGTQTPTPQPMTVNEAILTNVPEVKKSMFPTNIVDLPSGGKYYPEDNPLSSGTVEIKYMTAKEEDILTTESYIRTHVVIDKLLQSLLVSKINYDDLLLGDRNAIMTAARIYAFGKDYPITVTTPSGNEQKVIVNLEEIEFKEILDLGYVGRNHFEFTLPLSNKKIEFKLLTVKDQREIDQKLNKHKLKLKQGAPDIQLTTRLKQMILSVDGQEDRNLINLFVDNELMSIDSRAFRDYVNSIQPDINLEVEVVDEETLEPFRSSFNFGPQLFWPNAGV